MATFTSSTYFWDFGFDINAVQRPNTLSFLQNGLVAIVPSGVPNTPPIGVPSTPITFQENDTITFNVYDVTSKGSASGYMPIAAVITFLNAQTSQPQAGQPASSPFGSGSIPFQSGAQPVPQAVNGTTVIQVPASAFGGPLTGSSPFFGPSTFPVWNLLPQMKFVQTPGSFLFTVALIVRAPSGITTPIGTTERTFVIDPEMIVGGTNNAM